MHLALFNKTPLRHVAPKLLKAGFRPTFQHSLAKMNGPLDFSVGSILERTVCRTPDDSLDNLKLELLREWALIPQEVLQTSCEAFQSRLKSVIKNKVGCIEYMLLTIVIVSLAISPSNKFSISLIFLLRNLIKCVLP